MTVVPAGIGGLRVRFGLHQPLSGQGMGTPIRLNCGSLTDVPPAADLEERTACGSHVVLQFHFHLSEDQREAIIRHLGNALPNHSVFNSGGNDDSQWITVMPVIATSTVLEHEEEIRIAVGVYMDECTALLRKRSNGTLSSCYSEGIHGMDHCRFENHETGQIIEAPLDEFANKRVDPYFFALFAKSTSDFEVVASLFVHDYHDATKMLDVLKINA